MLRIWPAAKPRVRHRPGLASGGRFGRPANGWDPLPMRSLPVLIGLPMLLAATAACSVITGTKTYEMASPAMEPTLERGSSVFAASGGIPGAGSEPGISPRATAPGACSRAIPAAA